MRTRDSLGRLANAGRPLLAEADALVGDGEEDRILARILDSGSSPVAKRRRPFPLVAVAAALVAAAIAALASGLVGHSTSPTAKVGGSHHVALTGPRIQLAGYHFRTPAGFKDSNSPCTGGATDAFSAAASADGGCVEAFFMLSTGKYAIAPDAQPIQVAGTQGFLVTGSDSLTLYAPLPQEGQYSVYLMLIGKGLTADQMVAIAESGLPSPN
jgi:hypothetical protein